MSDIVKYIPFQSTADPSFWMKLGDYKLTTLKLEEAPVPLRASYTLASTLTHRSSDTATATATTTSLLPGRMRLDADSLGDMIVGEETVVKNEAIATKGQIVILNTMESFKKCNKNQVLNEHCLPSLLQACGIEDGEGVDGIEDLHALTSFFCLAHLDLKKHKVIYWFAFPVMAPAPKRSVRYYTTTEKDRTPQTPLTIAWGQEKVQQLQTAMHDLRLQLLATTNGYPPFFMVIDHKDGIECKPLSLLEYSNLSDEEQGHCTFAFLDPCISNSSSEQDVAVPLGMPLRNLIAYLTFKLNLQDQHVSIIAYRPNIIRRLDSASNDSNTMDPSSKDASLLLHIQLPKKEDYHWSSTSTTTSSATTTTIPESPKFQCLGWELNARGKAGPRSINLAPLLSPAHLAQQACDLNLKLMKWRMIPNLDLTLLSKLKVLLLGSGTLGCSVARTLLGWGVRDFTFVDNGKVSYSNPVRQNLFELVDCENGGKDKAVAAAEALQRIAGPTIQSRGEVLTIPMPGHAFAHKEEAGVQEDVQKLQDLVEECDIVFLLTDTRESRWLPTVMARASSKMLINAALGLDSWLVMRHGGNKEGRLGCYFCNDVVAPENSTNNRTLDQQCTVTRPGLAPIASSMAVELMVALLHHEQKENAPSPAPTTSFSPTVAQSDASSPLGNLPHQIRGSLVSYTMMTPTVPSFRFCTACCEAIVNRYKKDGFNFVKEVCCSDGTFLEDIAGLAEFRSEANAKMEDCLDWDESDEE